MSSSCPLWAASSSSLARTTTSFSPARDIDLGRGGDRRALDFHDQAFLAARHRQVDFRQQFRVEQRAVQRARRVVDLIALAQHVEVVALARMHVPRHAQRVDHGRAIVGDGLEIEQAQLVVEKRDIERRVVDDEFGAAHVFDEFGGDFAELRLVAQELGGQPVHLQRAFLALAFRIDVAVEMVAGQPPVDEFDAGDFDDAVAERRVEAGGFSVENDLSHV